MKHLLLNENGFTDYSYQGQVVEDNLYSYVKPPPPLSRWIQCFWELNIPAGRYVYRSVPDNNVDCIFSLNNTEEAFVVSPFYLPKSFEMDGPVSYFGVRFRVLAQQWLTTLPIGEWENASIIDIFGVPLIHSLLESIENEDNFLSRCNKVGKELLASLFYRGIDKRLMGFVRYAHQNTSSKNDFSDKQCAQFGLSARHLRRLSQLYLGLSPRNFSRVVRFQKTLHLMSNSRNASVWADYYYDQPHFIREFKALSGVTPVKFTNMSALYNTAKDSI